jgi:SAM-dependent methyltransferase
MSHAPYDLIADERIRERHPFREKQYVDQFLALTIPGAHLLDVGCGAATPIARYLLDRGYHVTGVDSSAAMLRLARANSTPAFCIPG